MKVRVIAEKCQGHAMCTLSCSEIFLLNDEDGHAYVLDEIVPPKLEAAVDQARRGCPEKAIELS